MANQPNSSTSASKTENGKTQRIPPSSANPAPSATPAPSTDTKRAQLRPTSVSPMLAVLIDPVELPEYQAARFRHEFPTVVSIELPEAKSKPQTTTNSAGHRFAATTEDEIDRVTCKISALYFSATFVVINFNPKSEERAKTVLSALQAIAGEENVVYCASPDEAIAKATEA